MSVCHYRSDRGKSFRLEGVGQARNDCTPSLGHTASNGSRQELARWQDGRRRVTLVTQIREGAARRRRHRARDTEKPLPMGHTVCAFQLDACKFKGQHRGALAASFLQTNASIASLKMQTTRSPSCRAPPETDRRLGTGHPTRLP